MKYKSQGHKGQTSIPIIVVIGAICTWCAGLSLGIFSLNGQTSGLTASVGDIKDTLDRANLPALKAEIDFLAIQRGYNPALTLTAASSTQ